MEEAANEVVAEAVIEDVESLDSEEIVPDSGISTVGESFYSRTTDAEHSSDNDSDTPDGECFIRPEKVAVQWRRPSIYPWSGCVLGLDIGTMKTKAAFYNPAVGFMIPPLEESRRSVIPTYVANGFHGRIHGSAARHFGKEFTARRVVYGKKR